MLAARPFQGQTAVRLWPFGLDTRPVHTGLYNLWSQVVPGAGQQGGSVVLLSLSVSIVFMGSSGFSKDLPLFCSNSNFFVKSLFSFYLMTAFKANKIIANRFIILTILYLSNSSNISSSCSSSGRMFLAQTAELDFLGILYGRLSARVSGERDLSEAGCIA